MLATAVDKSLDIAELIVYGILTLPAIYCLLRHGTHGILGWFYVVAFCSIRIVADILKLKSDADHSSSSSALIVDNIGLSPLLLGTAGILHEARFRRHAITNSKVEWLVVLQYHVLISAGLALIAASVSNLTSSNPSSKDMGMLKAGFAVIFVAWAVLLAGAVFSVRRPSAYTSLAGDASFRHGTLLLNTVIFSLPMSLLRAIYGAVNLFGGGGSGAAAIGTSAFSSNVAADVCMSFLPPMLATGVFVFIGVWTVPGKK